MMNNFSSEYQYIDSGMQNVFLIGGVTMSEKTGIVSIEHKDELDFVIASHLVQLPCLLSGHQSKFLRGWNGLSCADLSFMASVALGCILLWEQIDEMEVPRLADATLRSVFSNGVFDRINCYQQFLHQRNLSYSSHDISPLYIRFDGTGSWNLINSH